MISRTGCSLVLQYNADDVADIIRDLLVTYAGAPSAYIPLSAWQLETATFLGTLYSAIIANPTPVRQLISELIEQAALALWWTNRTASSGSRFCVA